MWRSRRLSRQWQVRLAGLQGRPVSKGSRNRRRPGVHGVRYGLHLCWRACDAVRCLHARWARQLLQKSRSFEGSANREAMRCAFVTARFSASFYCHMQRVRNCRACGLCDAGYYQKSTGKTACTPCDDLGDAYQVCIQFSFTLCTFGSRNHR